MFLALASVSYAANAPWEAIVVDRQTESEKLATIDLQRYLAQVTGKTPIILATKSWQERPRPAVILGSPKSNPLLERLPIPRPKMGDQGYYLANSRIKEATVVVAVGLTGEGATNAIYGLLRELGFGFYLGSEAIPKSVPSKLPNSPVIRQPVFRMRGVLPWYNFFNSPTTWDPIDHRAFADQLIRMGASFLGFHTYDHEPFGAYEQDRQTQRGSRLLNTQTPTWGTSSTRTRDFGFGTDKLYAREFFGADTTLDIADGDKAIRAEQEIMREALEYAKRRGLHTCIGYELFGDPLVPSNRDSFLKRLNHLLDRYPAVDYIWLWQAETQGAQGFASSYNQHILPSSLGPNSPLPRYGMARRQVFRRIVEESVGEAPFYQKTEEGRIARANEGARLEQFAQLAYHAMSHRKNPPKLVISGWGGDQRLLSAEYYDGLDKLLPRDVVFSSLDNIGPRPRVDAVYGVLPPERERWPIPWLENDGDQWQPQPYVHIYEGLARDAHKGGSQGMLGIHWRSRDVEENLAYLVDYAWNPKLTAKTFFQDYAARCYGPKIAAEMADVHTELDKLGYRWVGGAGQVECGGFWWGPGEEPKARELEHLRARAVSLLPESGNGKARLEWLLREMDWVLRYREAELDAVKVQQLVAQAANAEPDKKKQLGQEGLEILNKGRLAVALRAYAERLTTRGEYGVLATINSKAVVAWRDLRAKCAALAGRTDAEISSDSWQPDPQILLPRLLGSAPSGRDLNLAPIVLGGAKAWAHYRTLGQKEWKTQELQSGEKWVAGVTIPGSAVAAPGVEIAFSFSSDPAKPVTYGPISVTALPTATSPMEARPVRPAQPDNNLLLRCKEGTIFPVELEWNVIHDADYYKVLRGGAVLVETAVPMCPDIPEQPDVTYTVEAWRDGKVIARSKPITFAVPKRVPNEVFDLTTKTNAAGIALRWPRAKSPYVTSYKISRISSGLAPESAKDLGVIPASGSLPHVYWDSPPPGKWTYRVTPRNVAGESGSTVTATVEFAPKAGISPALELPLTSKPDGASAVGEVAFSPTGATFNGGHIVIPHRDVMNLNEAMTLTLEFKADRTDQMPVLLSHGQWQVDGWFVQIFNGQLIVRTPGGDAVGPAVETGKWYAVRFVFDGANYRLAVDGKWIEQTPVWTHDYPATRNLVIGQYEPQEPQYGFAGTMRNVNIYDDAIVEKNAAP